MISAENLSGSSPVSAQGPKETVIFGVPIGRLGLIARIMMCGACAFIAFFIAFVLAIIGVSIYDAVAGISIANLNIAYRYIAAPVGILALIASVIYLIGGWAKRRISSAQ